MNSREEKQSRSEILDDDILRILLIEEDNNVAQKVQSLVTALNASVDHALDHIEGQQLAQNLKYNLVILDITKDTDNKLDFIAGIKLKYPTLKLITITGDNSKMIETKVRELRVLYHFVKPLSSNEFSSLLEHISKREMVQK